MNVGCGSQFVTDALVSGRFISSNTGQSHELVLSPVMSPGTYGYKLPMRPEPNSAFVQQYLQLGADKLNQICTSAQSIGGAAAVAAIHDQVVQAATAGSGGTLSAATRSKIDSAVAAFLLALLKDVCALKFDTSLKDFVPIDAWAPSYHVLIDAVDPGFNVQSVAFDVGASGPVPLQKINFQNASFRLTTDPPNPAIGQPYVAKASVMCLPSGSDLRLTVLGTDGATGASTAGESGGAAAVSVSMRGRPCGVVDTLVADILSRAAGTSSTLVIGEEACAAPVAGETRFRFKNFDTGKASYTQQFQQTGIHAVDAAIMGAVSMPDAPQEIVLTGTGVTNAAFKVRHNGTVTVNYSVTFDPQIVKVSALANLPNVPTSNAFNLFHPAQVEQDFATAGSSRSFDVTLQATLTLRDTDFANAQTITLHGSGVASLSPAADLAPGQGEIIAIYERE